MCYTFMMIFIRHRTAENNQRHLSYGFKNILFGDNNFMHYVDLFPIGVFGKSGTTKIWGGAFAPPAPPLVTPLRMTTFTKTLPHMSFHLNFFAIFISLSGSTHDSVDWWSAHRPQLPATASNVCTTDAWLGGDGRVTPQTKILATPVRLCIYLLIKTYLYRVSTIQ